MEIRVCQNGTAVFRNRGSFNCGKKFVFRARSSRSDCLGMAVISNDASSKEEIVSRSGATITKAAGMGHINKTAYLNWRYKLEGKGGIWTSYLAEARGT